MSRCVPSPNIPRPTSGPVRWAPWASCMRSKGCATAHGADNPFQWLIRQVDGRMIVLSDTAFHATEGDPANLKLCRRGEWEERMLVETVLSMLTVVLHFKQVMPRGWAYFQARLA